MSRLLNEMKSMKRGKYYYINEELRKDVKWWYLFLPGFKGTSILWLLDVERVDAEMAIDACMRGAGGVCNQEYYRVMFPRDIITPETEITHLELWAVLLSVHLWGLELSGKIIRIKTDNEAVSQILNTGRSQDLLLQKLLQELTWWLALYQFRIKGVHLSGKLNRIPGLLSRWHKGRQVQQQFCKMGGEHMKQRFIKACYFQFTHDW